jgi:DNA gyrase/topoisomerase IV subunit A
MSTEHLSRRIELLSGLVYALDHWSDIGQVVHGAADRQHALRLLTETSFPFSALQAEHVLDLTFTKLAQKSRTEIKEELEALKRQQGS